jgi:hypothetical protein
MKSLLHMLTAAALAGLSGCNLVQARPEFTLPAAIGVEAAAGVRCARQAERGAQQSLPRRIVLENGRILFDTVAAPALSEIQRSGLARSRALTDGVCPALPVAPAAPG